MNYDEYVLIESDEYSKVYARKDCIECRGDGWYERDFVLPPATCSCVEIEDIEKTPNVYDDLFLKINHVNSWRSSNNLAKALRAIVKTCRQAELDHTLITPELLLNIINKELK